MGKDEAIDLYLRQILEENEKVNVTAITDLGQARILHTEDSLLALSILNQAMPGVYMDLGTGGGFPGVPLAIMTGRKTILVDSVQKKLSAIQNALSGIPFSGNISTVHSRIEDLCEMYRGKVSVITARALSSLPSLLELASPLLKDKGLLICYKAQLTQDELDRGDKVCELVGMKRIELIESYLSDKQTKRTLVIYSKESDSKLKLPRKVGMAQKKPLA